MSRVLSLTAIRQYRRRCVRCLHFAVRPGLAHRTLSFELEAVGVVDEAIKDGIGEGGIADEIVPGFDGELAGYQR